MSETAKRRQRLRDQGLCIECGKIEATRKCDYCKARDKQRRKDRQERALAAGMCKQCHTQPQTNGKYCEKCATLRLKCRRNQYHNRIVESRCAGCGTQTESRVCQKCRNVMIAAKKDLRDQRRKNKLCVECGQPAGGLLHCAKCLEAAQSRRQSLRLTVFESYGGPMCKCCGETIREFLAVDHIDGQGAMHRRTIQGDIYNWLKRNNYPAGFQVLCANCNAAKGANKKCPHQLLREAAISLME